MTRLGRFLRLPPADRRLLAEAAVVLAVTRLGLWLVPTWRLRRAMVRASRRVRSEASTSHSCAQRAGWAVTRASMYIPRATCLPQALAVLFLLERRGYSPDLRIGLTRATETQVEGHAWVEHEGEVVLGGDVPTPEIVLSNRGDRAGW